MREGKAVNRSHKLSSKILQNRRRLLTPIQNPRRAKISCVNIFSRNKKLSDTNCACNLTHNKFKIFVSKEKEHNTKSVDKIADKAESKSSRCNRSSMKSSRNHKHKKSYLSCTHNDNSIFRSEKQVPLLLSPKAADADVLAQDVSNSDMIGEPSSFLNVMQNEHDIDSMAKSNSSILLCNNDGNETNTNSKYLASGSQCSWINFKSASMANLKSHKQFRKSQCIETNETNKIAQNKICKRIKRMSQKTDLQFYEGIVKSTSQIKNQQAIWDGKGINDFLKQRKARLK